MLLPHRYASGVASAQIRIGRLHVLLALPSLPLLRVGALRGTSGTDAGPNTSAVLAGLPRSLSSRTLGRERGVADGGRSGRQSRGRPPGRLPGKPPGRQLHPVETTAPFAECKQAQAPASTTLPERRAKTEVEQVAARPLPLADIARGGQGTRPARGTSQIVSRMETGISLHHCLLPRVTQVPRMKGALPEELR